MAIGKIVNKRREGLGNNAHYVLHIVLLPSFPADRYNELDPGRQYATTQGSGATLWSESGHQLETIASDRLPSDSAFAGMKIEYPYALARSLDDGNVFGKVTNDDKEAIAWIKKQADDLFPSRLKQIIPGYGIAAAVEYENVWKPIRQRLDSAQHASEAYSALQAARRAKSGPQTAFGRPYQGSPSMAANTVVPAASAGKQALVDAKNELKNEVGSWWDDLSGGYKIAAGAVIGIAIIGTAMTISERFD